MNMKLWGAAIVAACLVSVAVAQQETQPGKAKAYEPRKIVITPQPVTKQEAGKIFLQVNSAIAKVMPKLRPMPIHLAGEKPVTREEIVNELDKIFQMAKPEFKFTPRKVSYDPSLLTIKDKGTRTKLEKLISWGCVDKVGTLATSSKDTMGVMDFGDTVGLMTARVAELTHMPDPRFSPDLQAP